MPDPAASRLRFHLDENMDPDIATALRRAGIDVTTTQEEDMLGEPDEVQFAHATSEGRVLVTDDTDLLALAARAPGHSGIVYCRRTAHSMGEIIRFLILIHGVYEAAEMAGRVEYV